MIELITGLPGACKTLYTLTYIKERSEKENRPVYYAGIKDLMLPWTEIDATKWFECPSGSIIVIDECQTVFRPRSFGSQVPDYVARLETHRHQGLDIILITQHPLLCDPSIRRLAGRHVHCIRMWGMQKSTLHEWNSVRENCDKPAGRTDSIKHHWKFDKRSYAFYKSAEVHTVKRRIPMRVFVLFVGMPLILGFLAWKFYSSVQSKIHPDASTSVPARSSGGSVPLAVDGRNAAYLDPVADAKQYVFDRTPRVSGLQLTAPRYDKVTEPKKAPIPSACVASETRCSCYSQQATILDVPEPMCREIVAKGFFVDFDDGGGNGPQRASADGYNDAFLVRAADVPVVRQADPQVASAVLSTGDDSVGYGVLGSRRDGLRQPGQ